MQTGTDPLVNRTPEETSQIARTEGTTLEGVRAVAVSATNSDRVILGIAITTIVRSTLVSSNKVADGITNVPEGPTEASLRTVLVLGLRRRK